MKISILFFAFLTLTVLACRKEDNNFGLPAATQNGANTFGCLVDGKPWVADIASYILDPTLRSLDMNYDETGSWAFHNNSWYMAAKLVNDSIHDKD